jgi:AraC family transcriptional regulator, mar-sox-rob regulon activator
MSHQKIIQDLIAWIDEHIDQPLNIDVVAKKSGYSKWYLQRMFRTVTNWTDVLVVAAFRAVIARCVTRATA